MMQDGVNRSPYLYVMSFISFKIYKYPWNLHLSDLPQLFRLASHIPDFPRLKVYLETINKKEIFKALENFYIMKFHMVVRHSCTNLFEYRYWIYELYNSKSDYLNSDCECCRTLSRKKYYTLVFNSYAASTMSVVFELGIILSTPVNRQT